MNIPIITIFPRYTFFMLLGFMAYFQGTSFAHVSDIANQKISAKEASAEMDPDVWSFLRPDPKPTHLARNSHFLISNENHQDRFYAALSSRQGDVYIGVGTEQNYLLGGWSRPDLMVLMDFDQAVVDLHRVYRVMFLLAENPTDFLTLWQDASITREAVESMILKEYGAKAELPVKPFSPHQICDPKCKSVIKAYHAALVHHLVEHRLAWIQKQYLKRGIPTFLTDDLQYQYIRALFQRRQVVMLRGDLSKNALGEIAEAMTKSHRKLGTLYLSNAERYFSYLPNFKLNVEALPIGPYSLVLHTWALKNQGNKYAYFIQRADHFVACLQKPNITSVRSILRPYLRGVRAGKFGRFPHPALMIEKNAMTPSKRIPKKDPVAL